ncbi:MAG TPA: hypothetical protein PKV16_06135 [Caldisericia bacterium]|nr:hypothetical protein [Caldisericia bacterium]HPF49232.1 hypothetical protein [Caldisericia bacterium]HPI84088.1 hypothetical protein [Caldisericia bacterium]HPQ93346.1 hypothetical protein [Caldisericia bacterium]HRV75272.1 hypothetical protein [Caldisericia bacterium]
MRNKLGNGKAKSGSVQTTLKTFFAPITMLFGGSSKTNVSRSISLCMKQGSGFRYIRP